jgi:hypothetical protein
MAIHGTHSTDGRQGRVKRVKDAQQPERKQGGKERGRVGARAEARHEERQDLVLVEWEDSFGCSSSWESLEGVQPAVLICRSVGWLIYDGDDCKVVVPHLTQLHNSAKRQGCGDMTIPTRAIISIKPLR